jgi:hypothetical protein
MKKRVLSLVGIFLAMGACLVAAQPAQFGFFKGPVLANAAGSYGAQSWSTLSANLQTQRDVETGNGSTTAFALAHIPQGALLQVYDNGVLDATTAYTTATASGVTTLTFGTAPVSTHRVDVCYNY